MNFIIEFIIDDVDMICFTGKSESVSTNHLAANGLHHVITIEGAFSFAQGRMKHDLKEQIAELLAVRLGVFHGLVNFVGLFQEIGLETFE